jgi:iron complex transport system ATP-binding protein
MIAVERLTLSLGNRTVVHDLSFVLERGRVTAILGPNGAGKTSLIRAMAGLIPARSGRIFINDQPLNEIPQIDLARRIGYLPQDGEPAWNLSAFELAALGRLPHRSRFSAPSEKDDDAVFAALAATDTSRFAARPIGSLSGGERARVKMARVLAGDPHWILADEPLANLDPPHQRDMLGLLRSAAKRGKGAIAVLHQLEAATQADDVLILKEGSLIAFGPTRDVLTPNHLESAFGMPFEIIEKAGRIVILPGA